MEKQLSLNFNGATFLKKKRKRVDRVLIINRTLSNHLVLVGYFFRKNQTINIPMATYVI